MKKQYKTMLCIILVGALMIIPEIIMAASGKPIVLRAVSFQPGFIETMDPWAKFVERVNTRAKGELKIDWLGGPEVIPVMDLGEAVANGVMEIGVLPASYYPERFPEAEVLLLSKYTPSEEREIGFHEYLTRRHKDAGLHYLGRSEWTEFWIFTKKHINKPMEMKGQRIASWAIYDEFLEALGAVPKFLEIADTYTAVERGVVDGFSSPMCDITGFKLHELLKYWINHPFYTSSDAVVVINPTVWSKLPQHLKDLLNEVQKEGEPEFVAYGKEIEKRAIDAMTKAGLKPINFSPQDAQFYFDLAIDEKWKVIKKRLDKAGRPELYDELRKMLVRR